MYKNSKKKIINAQKGEKKLKENLLKNLSNEEKN